MRRERSTATARAARPAGGGDDAAASSDDGDDASPDRRARPRARRARGARGAAARVRFLLTCLSHNVRPEPLLLRGLSQGGGAMNLASYGMGDARAQALAEALSTLAGLEAIDVSDNRLSAASLAPLLANVDPAPLRGSSRSGATAWVRARERARARESARASERCARARARVPLARPRTRRRGPRWDDAEPRTTRTPEAAPPRGRC